MKDCNFLRQWSQYHLPVYYSTAEIKNLYSEKDSTSDKRKHTRKFISIDFYNTRKYQVVPANKPITKLINNEW